MSDYTPERWNYLKALHVHARLVRVRINHDRRNRRKSELTARQWRKHKKAARAVSMLALRGAA